MIKTGAIEDMTSPLLASKSICPITTKVRIKEASLQ